MTTDPEQPKTRPWVVVVGVLAVAAGLGWSVLKVADDPTSLPMKDFVEYWSAAKANLAGGNPYDPATLKPYQEEALKAEVEHVTMMWNPPWVLALVTPLGVLPAAVGHVLFLLVQLAALLLAGTWLWKVYAGPPKLIWVAWLVTLGFAPSVFIFWWGQIGGLVLLGLAGFLYFHKQDRPIPAGLFVALTAIKPHLLFAVGLVLILDAVVSKRTRIAVAVGAVALAAAAVAAYLMNPAVYAHYAGAGWESPTGLHISPKNYAQPLVSYWLREWLAPESFRVQFVPMLLTAAAVVAYWWGKRAGWNWPAEAPGLIFASVLTTPYGAWIFDLVVLLVPVIARTVELVEDRSWRRPVWFGGLVLLTLAAVFSPWVVQLLTGVFHMPIHYFIGVTPAVLLLWLAVRPASPTKA
jgi:hypothetical protein